MSGEDKYRLFLGGDENAFEGIMREYFDGLIFFINRYVNDPHTAEDIAIDVFAYIAENRRKYNFKVSLKTYIYMIGKSRALNLIKHTFGGFFFRRYILVQFLGGVPFAVLY